MSETMIDVDEFAARARAWLAENMPPANPDRDTFFLYAATHPTDEEVLARAATCRELQRRLFDGGFAGICVPTRYGGQGLTPAHQAAFNREIKGYDYPAEIQASTFIPCMAVLLEFGTEEQKQRHIPRMLRGEEIWVQLLSEPGGGSDAAGAVTTATRDGDRWILNGSKVWTTSGWWGDWALCLARTNWDVAKHQGLTVFSLPMSAPGLAISQIELVNGSKDFCQEFLTDVVVPDADRIGDVDAGWNVMGRWLYHERTISGGSPYVTGGGNRPNDGPYEPAAMIAAARRLGTIDDSRTRALLGEAQTSSLVLRALVESVTRKMAGGVLPHHAAAMTRLFGGTSNARRAAIATELYGGAGVVWAPGEETAAQVGLGYLTRQAACIGGGTTEMARNVIAERLLGLPREQRADTGAFRDVPRGPQATGGQ
ncbi:acyl-CoA dehydrogenase family protein [Parafrankia sp. EUN1f]|uniref:acyl-CoA dehydrogenase family protein n=1 Tax=Parafrankia sp. EUN1f TaxID=102897 RepID=UPI0001C441C4|nr:acyl-CoA dehydrogenase family protein [Parafrankia sp. EUN1f]EFC86702.1 acyl-CoA dehydrogenase domain protein [Parafrankia sp. EUN1f]